MELVALRISQVMLYLLAIAGCLTMGRLFYLAIGGWLGIVMGVGVFLCLLISVIVAVNEDK